MSTAQGQPLILAIGSQDDFVHTYQNDKDLLADNAIGPAPGQFSGPIEFFDSDGQRLTGCYDRQGNLLALNPTTDLLALIQRVRNAFDRARSFVDDNPEVAAEFGMEVKDALARLPHLSTSADLREFLQVFVSRPDSETADPPDETADPPDAVNLSEPGNTGHNFLHRIGINHD